MALMWSLFQTKPITCISVLCIFLFCNAAPHPSQPRSPFILNPISAELVHNNTASHFFPRSTSQDPSCPPGFLCVQESCPGNIVCGPGETCIDFEGTIACVVPGLDWCALNPTTFEGVGCAPGGLCCHGNCYTADAVCCDFPSIQCAVGTLCNACNPGQTCGNGQCADSSSPATTSTSTSSVSVASPSSPASTAATTPTPHPTSASPVSTSPPTSSSPVTVPPATTGTSSVSLPTSSTSASPSTSTLPANIPTDVPAVGNFESIGCFTDSSTAPVLAADNSTDQSATGMTVEKCVTLALSSGWKYAGLESGGTCFLDDVLANPTTLAGQADCNTPCAGNHSEICGGSNRILIYEDVTWFDPTAAELAAEIVTYNQTLQEINNAILVWQNDIAQLQANTSTAKRQSITQTTVVQAGERIVALEQGYKSVSGFVGSIILRGGRLGSASQSQVSQYIQLQDMTDTQVSNVASRAAADAATVAADDTAVIPLAEDAAVVEQAASVIGLPALLGPTGVVATGVFFLIFGLFESFQSSGSSGPGTTAAPTSTTSMATASSTSTSTSTAMSTPTSFVIYTKLNTSISDFNNLVQELGPPSKTSEQIVFPNLSFQAYVTDLNATQLQTAQSNPIVQVVAEDLQFVDDTSTDFDGTPLSKRHLSDYTRNLRTGLKIERIPAMADNANNNFSMLLKRDTIVTQSNSPSHLKLISQPSGASGTVPDYTYDSAAAGRGVTVYFLDTGVRASHIEFSSNPPEQEVVPQAGPSNADTFKHGTTVMSTGGGAFAGVAKSANLVMVKFDFDVQTVDDQGRLLPPLLVPQFNLGTVTQAFMFVLNDVVGAVQSHQMLFGQAVINLSSGFNLAFPHAGGDPNAENAFQYLLDQVYGNDIVFVTSAGNGNTAISGDGLKQLGGPDTPMIVVGGVDSTGARWPQSNFGPALTVNAQSVGTICASANDDTSYIPIDGTSQASGMVSGLAAYFLSKEELITELRVQGEVAFRVKNYIIATAGARTLPAPAVSLVACNGETLTAAEKTGRDTEFDNLNVAAGLLI